MSCPDWTALAAHRHDRRGVEPDGWQTALEHFDSCPACRREALAADPTLLFRRLPEIARTPDDEEAEVHSMRQAVAAMRSASRIEASQRSFAGWRRWAAAAVLALAALSLGRDGGPTLDRAEAVATSSVPELGGQPVSGPKPPLHEGLDLPDARVYQVDDEEFRVLMVYDESFETLLDV
ncbi:MAG TPA: hypothetical protein VE685_26325 [Thermoanaerobaculia bacterium]|nr:hypothetical protein [Thermoanaerobaculia bacterium]